MKDGFYHSFLRIAALTFAVVLIFDSGIFTPITKELSHNTQDYLAQAVGVGASVQPTNINQLTAQISERERELDAREGVIAEREIEVGLNNSVEVNARPDLSTYILSTILFILVVLITLNYALDFTRERRLLYQNEKQMG